MTDEAQRKIDAFLGRLRAGLRDVSAEEVREIVEELRSHILDRAVTREGLTPAGVDAALAGLGTPEDLASQYLTDNLLARAEVSRSPLHVLRSLFHWASLSVAGLFVFVSSLIGYFMGCVFLLLAVLKPWHPRTAGVWLIPQSGGDSEISFRLGFGTPPPGAHELLGWWIVPLGLVVGFGLIVGTTRFALWCGRRYRKSHALP